MKFHFLFIIFATAQTLLGALEVPETLKEKEQVKEQVQLKEPIKEEKVSEKGWQRHNNVVKGFSILTPPNWEITQVAGVDFMAFLPVDSEKDNFKENVSVVSENLDTEINLNDFFDANLVSLKEQLGEFKPLTTTDVKIGAIPAKRIVYTHQLQKVNLVVVQYFFLLGKHAYVITASSNEEQFKNYEAIFDEIAKTFQPLPKKEV